MENCEIYLTGVVYKDQCWYDNPDFLLDQIYNNLNEISGFIFSSISINMSQVYNVSLKQSNYDSMIMFLKNVKYNSTDFLKLIDVQTLIQKITQQMKYIEGLSFVGIEIRCKKSYSDNDLGLVTIEKQTSSKLIIIESL